MREHGEEADEVRHARFAWNGCSIRVDETPVRPPAQLTRILEQSRYDVAADVTKMRKRRELRRQPAAATAHVHDQVIVFETTGAEQIVFEFPDGNEFAADGAAQRVIRAEPVFESGDVLDVGSGCRTRVGHSSKCAALEGALQCWIREQEKVRRVEREVREDAGFDASG